MYSSSNERKGVAVDQLDYLGMSFKKVTDVISRYPGTVRDLEDHELLAVATWTRDSDEIITDECRRRAEQGRRFSAYLSQRALTRDDLIAISDVLRRVQDAARTGDPEILRQAAAFANAPGLETALEKVDDIKMTIPAGQS